MGEILSAPTDAEWVVYSSQRGRSTFDMSDSAVKLTTILKMEGVTGCICSHVSFAIGYPTSFPRSVVSSQNSFCCKKCKSTLCGVARTMAGLLSSSERYLDLEHSRSGHEIVAQLKCDGRTRLYWRVQDHHHRPSQPLRSPDFKHIFE